MFLNSSVLDETQYQRVHVPWKEGCPLHTLFLRDKLAVDLLTFCLEQTTTRVQIKWLSVLGEL